MDDPLFLIDSYLHNKQILFDGKNLRIYYIGIAKDFMIKNDNKSATNEPICKKIQNYIFKFTDMLGKGNFSKVYKAHHQLTNQIVAIKIIQLNSLKSQKLEQLLFSQIDVLKKLNHPNILRCYEVFTSNRNCYIITQLCNGGDLQTKLRREHHFSQFSAQPIIKDIFSGLLYLAHKNVIHRDLKVANVFLHNGRAKIADFGFAKFTKENFKDINIGSPIYMSPQGLIHNIYGPKTDIWAFGVLIYELLHGETPFAHCRTESELKYSVSIAINPKKMREQLSHQIKQIITLCMEIDETKRVTAMDLQKLPYFQRMIDKSPLRRIDSPVIEKKLSTASQKYVNPSSLNQKSIQRHNFLMPKQQDLQLNKKSSSPLYPQRYEYNNVSPIQTRNLAQTEKKYFEPVQKNQTLDIKLKLPEISHNPKTPQKINEIHQPTQSKIFSTSLTFKQCVNLLHYCRLVYKYVILLKQTHPTEQTQIKVLSSWVLNFIDEMKTKINEGGVVYDGQNKYKRQQKLRQVTNQYTKKYTLQLGQPLITDLTLKTLLNHLKTFYEKIDRQIEVNKLESWLSAGHYIVMIIESTHILKKSYQEENYMSYSGYKDLEQFLTKNKDTMDSHSYKVYRKKLSYIKEKA